MKLEGYRTYICIGLFIVLKLLSANGLLTVPTDVFDLLFGAGAGALAARVVRK